VSAGRNFSGLSLSGGEATLRFCSCFERTRTSCCSYSVCIFTNFKFRGDSTNGDVAYARCTILAMEVKLRAKFGTAESGVASFCCLVNQLPSEALPIERLSRRCRSRLSRQNGLHHLPQHHARTRNARQGMPQSALRLARVASTSYSLPAR
jgi:hypothetical protein